MNRMLTFLQEAYGPDSVGKDESERMSAFLSSLQRTPIDTLKTYDERRDQFLRCFGLPYWQAIPLLREEHQYLTQNTSLASLCLPAMGQVYFSQARCDRNLAALRIVEAIRMHAAANGAKLPATLDEITEVPLPIDPMTGKAFEYKREGETAILPWPDSESQRPLEQRVVFELQMAK
jgi:hypothetical protein